jgi:hypothetical protein
MTKKITFTGDESEQIPLALAAQWTANYRAKNPKGIKAYFFGINPLRRALRQKHCVGLRMYYALDEKGVQQLVLTGVDAQGNDLFNGIILDRAIPCPPYCDNSNSPLNG